jgi:hypothetical protein
MFSWCGHQSRLVCATGHLPTLLSSVFASIFFLHSLAGVSSVVGMLGRWRQSGLIRLRALIDKIILST